MKQQLRTSSDDLLACFFSECEKRFRFLEQHHGYLYLSGLATYKNNYKIIVPYKGTQAPEPFLAVTRYEKNAQAIELIYGDQDYILEVFLYVDPITRISLKDLMAAHRTPFAMPHKMAWVTQSASINELLEALSALMRGNLETILNPNAKLVERALTMRSKLTEQAVRENYKKLLDDASIRAAQAYTQKDFALVLEILMPFKKDLSKADLKKLRLAQENI